jgi:hypothetical protein
VAVPRANVRPEAIATVPNIRPNVLRLTYRELGERLGMSADGARMLTKRRMWPVEVGNDRLARVAVSEGEIAAEAERLAERSDRTIPEQLPNDRGEEANVRPNVPALVELLGELRDVLLRTRAERDQARAAAERWRTEAEQARLGLARAEEQVAAARAVAVADVEAAKRVAEAEIAARDEVIAELRRQLEHERQQLAEARRPWWRRWFG